MNILDPIFYRTLFYNSRPVISPRVHLLHVHMLEINQLMCYIGFGFHRVCIAKELQLLAIRSLERFVTSFFVIYFIKFSFLLALYFDNKIDFYPTFSPTAFMSNNMSFHFVHVGKTFSTTNFPIASLRILSSFASARGTMMLARVAVACIFGTLGFFKPMFLW